MVKVEIRTDFQRGGGDDEDGLCLRLTLYPGADRSEVTDDLCRQCARHATSQEVGSDTRLPTNCRQAGAQATCRRHSGAEDDGRLAAFHRCHQLGSSGRERVIWLGLGLLDDDAHALALVPALGQARVPSLLLVLVPADR